MILFSISNTIISRFFSLELSRYDFHLCFLRLEL
uniref:Uncharacterized protein n=1 Tax=Moniliophthora roreri TaxID=221103 RepID=A0A0W0FMA8_MONRR